jgi:hypothetical protein
VSIIHTVAHFGNYTTLPVPFSELLFETNAGLTGFFLWVVIIIMFLGTSERTFRHKASRNPGASETVRRGTDATRMMMQCCVVYAV